MRRLLQTWKFPRQVDIRVSRPKRQLPRRYFRPENLLTNNTYSMCGSDVHTSASSPVLQSLCSVLSFSPWMYGSTEGFIQVQDSLHGCVEALKVLSSARFSPWMFGSTEGVIQVQWKWPLTNNKDTITNGSSGNWGCGGTVAIGAVVAVAIGAVVAQSQ